MAGPLREVRLPARRFVVEPDEVGQCAVERARDLRELAHVEPGAVLERRERLVGREDAHPSQSRDDLLLREPELTSASAQPLTYHQVSVRPEVFVGLEATLPLDYAVRRRHRHPSPPVMSANGCTS